MRLSTILIATTMLAFAAPAAAQQDGGVPAFRVPMGGSGSASSGPAVYAWIQNVGTCSNACGNGTRATTYQCQDTNAYDFGGDGYGTPEADSFCSAITPKPAASSVACTNFSGCSYDWVKPAVSTTIVAKPNPPGADYPKGAVGDCSYAKRTFSPYCQRLGDSNVQMPAGDHAFCRSDRPDYDDVSSGNPDALGYDRTTEVTTACTPGARDYGWKTGDWVVSPVKAPETAACTGERDQTRTVECVLKFNGTVVTGSNCTGIAKPATTGKAAADYSSCSYVWESGAYGAWSSTCSTAATRTRSITCRRSDGQLVPDDKCGGGKPAASETGPNLVDCGYEWTTPTEWKYASNCSSNTTRSRTTSCRRADGVIVADSQCLASTKPSIYETGVSDYSICTYAPRDMGKSECANSQQNQYWDCTRADGTVGFPASYCGKTNPEVVGCTMPPVYTYSPVNRGETACANSQKQVYWDCTRNDGQTGFPASMCGKTNPTTEACTMPWTYNWATGGWGGYDSGCSANATRYRSVTCVRNDGYTDSDQFCNAPARPAAQESTAVFSSCTYQTEAISSFTSCGSNGTQTRQVQCRRSDQTIVANSFCGSNGTQTQSCPYTPTVGAVCNGGTILGVMGDAWTGAAGNPWRTGSDAWATNVDGCNQHGGNCVQDNYSVGVSQEQGGDRENRHDYVCYSGSSGVTSGVCNSTASGGCTPVAAYKQPEPRCESTRDNLYQYSCEGGTLLFSGGSSWRRNMNDMQSEEHGQYAKARDCFANGGTCVAQYDTGFSDYGNPEGGSTDIACFRGGNVVQSTTFVSDSFNQVYTNACQK